MVEGARLESVYTGNCIEGSNPSVSALTSIVLTKEVFLCELFYLMICIYDLMRGSKKGGNFVQFLPYF